MTNYPIESFQYKLLAEGYKFFTDFVKELMDYGIETVEQFQNSYQGKFESEGHFVEQMLDDCEPMGIPTWVCIDYQLSWDSALRHDYFSINTGYNRYEIFSQYF